MHRLAFVCEMTTQAIQWVFLGTILQNPEDPRFLAESTQLMLRCNRSLVFLGISPFSPPPFSLINTKLL